MVDDVDVSRRTVRDVIRTGADQPLVVLTAYSAPMASLIDPYVDMILVGDSLGQIVHGLPDTMAVTMEMMVLHTQAVMRGSRRSLVVADMPFASYQESWQQGFSNACRLVREGGCQAVKIECGGDYAIDTVSALVDRGIAVIAHLGLLPQEVHVRGGHVVRGGDSAEGSLLVERARAAEEAGSFALVVEGVYEDIASAMTASVRCPVIGIGASGRCGGQVLVTDDLIGMTGLVPRFVRRYADVGSVVRQAVSGFARDVRAGDFPAESETYGRSARLCASSIAG